MKNNHPCMLVGSGGSNRIRSAIVQVILNFIYKNYEIEKAISSSRIHLEGNQLYFEPGVEISENNVSDFISLHPFEKKNLFFGGVNAVTLTDGASDNRRGGSYEII